MSAGRDRFDNIAPKTVAVYIRRDPADAGIPKYSGDTPTELGTAMGFKAKTVMAEICRIQSAEHMAKVPERTRKRLETWDKVEFELTSEEVKEENAEYIRDWREKAKRILESIRKEKRRS